MSPALGETAISERLRRLREEAQEQFDALPWPGRTDEQWRRTDPTPFLLDGWTLPVNGRSFTIRFDCPPATERSPQGVVALPLSRALQEQAPLVERFLFRGGEPEGLAKWTALHKTHWSEGFFVYVPPGVSVQAPLRVVTELTQSGAAAFPHGVVAVEAAGALTLVDERRSAAGKTFSDEWVEMFVGEGGSLRYVRLQHLGEEAVELYTQRAVLGKEAQLLNITVGMGAAVAKANLETTLTAPGARAQLLGLFFGHRRQHFDCHTLQDHTAPHSSTDLLYESALRDTAQAIYTGLIRIRKSAQKSDAYQHNRNLLLSQGAKADSIPMLEIEADDVRCTHGVAVGPVDEEQLYYLMSRGLTPAQAQHLVVEGFFDRVLRRIPIESVRESLMQEIDARLG